MEKIYWIVSLQNLIILIVLFAKQAIPGAKDICGIKASFDSWDDFLEGRGCGSPQKFCSYFADSMVVAQRTALFYYFCSGNMLNLRKHLAGIAHILRAHA